MQDTKQQELELWLSQKLTSDWVGERAASRLNEDVLSFFSSRNDNGEPRIKFLETGVKMRLLLSCLALRKKQLAELNHYYLTLFDEGKEDAEEWVKVVSGILSTFPANNSLQTTMLHHPTFQQTVRNFELKFHLSEDSQANMACQPIIHQYINQRNSQSVGANQHFQLRSRDNILQPTKFLDALVRDDKSSFNEDASKPFSDKFSQQQPNISVTASLPSALISPTTTTPSNPDRKTRAPAVVPLTPAPTPPRVMKVFDERETIKRIQLQQEAAKKRRVMLHDENSEVEQERRRKEEKDANERKEQERAEKKRKREEEKKRKTEEHETKRTKGRAAAATVASPDSSPENSPPTQQQPQQAAAGLKVPSFTFSNLASQFNLVNPFTALQASQQQQQQQQDNKALQQILSDALNQSKTMKPFAPTFFQRPVANKDGEKNVPVTTSTGVGSGGNNTSTNPSLSSLVPGSPSLANLYSGSNSAISNLLGPMFFNPKVSSKPLNPQLQPPPVQVPSPLTSISSLMAKTLGDQKNPASTPSTPLLLQPPQPQQMAQPLQQPQMTQLQLPQIPQLQQLQQPQLQSPLQSPSPLQQSPHLPLNIFAPGRTFPFPGVQKLPSTSVPPPTVPPPPAQQLQNVAFNSPQAVTANLLKGCNRVTEAIRIRVVNFLSGKRDSDSKTEELLLHEETKKENNVPELHQIFLQIDYHAGTWKKFLKRISQ